MQVRRRIDGRWQLTRAGCMNWALVRYGACPSEMLPPCICMYADHDA